MKTRFTRKERRDANPYGGKNIVYFNPEMYIDSIFNEMNYNERIDGDKGCIFDIHEIREQQAAILMGLA